MGYIQNGLATYATGIANDSSHGYSQVRRGDRDKDCSSLVLDAVRSVGLNTGSATYTGDMYQPLLRVGFVDVTASVDLRTGAGLIMGDIVLRPKTMLKNGHTAIMINEKQLVQAQYDYDGVFGDSSGREIRIQNYYDSPFKYVLRFPEAVIPVPPIAIINNGIEVDGIIGAQAINLWQRVMGTPVTGKISDTGSTLIKSVQTFLNDTVNHVHIFNMTGSSTISVDGNFGDVTKRVLVFYLTGVDSGAFNTSAKKALQIALNKSVIGSRKF